MAEVHRHLDTSFKRGVVELGQLNVVCMFSMANGFQHPFLYCSKGMVYLDEGPSSFLISLAKKFASN